MTAHNSFYERNILDRYNDINFMPSLEGEKKTAIIQSTEQLLPDLSYLGFKENRNKGGVYYISDIHLDHKLFKKFGRKVSDRKIRYYLYGIAQRLLLNDDEKPILYPVYGESTRIILGDTSHNFEINKIFFSYLSQLLPFYRDLFVVLGNHELWEFKNPEEAVKAYQEFFDTLPNIHLLHNSLYVEYLHSEVEEELEKYRNERIALLKNKELSWGERQKLIKKSRRKSDKIEQDAYGKTEEERHKNRIKQSILDQTKLENATAEEIQKICFDSKRIIFGAVGYAQYNPVHNANSGLYRNSIATKEQEKKYSEQTERLYKKITEAIPNNDVIIASHMAYGDWSKYEPQEKWAYFSGHTHINKKTMSEKITEYADNQVGYYGKRIKFNAVAIEEKVDYFTYYKDGIYSITDAQYRDFYTGFSKALSSIDKRGCENSNIIMLKNEEVYLFLIKNNKGKLFLLEGGKRHSLANQDVRYYFDNMKRICTILTEAVSGIRGILEKLSMVVKQIGGLGYIHGNIIDIDTFNHIMVDIETGKIIPYFALSIDNRLEFNNIPELLESNRQDLYKKYIEDKQMFLAIRKDLPARNTVNHSSDTSIYRNSNIMLKIQDMIDYNVIRFWNDDLIEAINKKENSHNKGIKLIN